MVLLKSGCVSRTFGLESSPRGCLGVRQWKERQGGAQCLLKRPLATHILKRTKRPLDGHTQTAEACSVETLKWPVTMDHICAWNIDPGHVDPSRHRPSITGAGRAPIARDHNEADRRLTSDAGSTKDGSILTVFRRLSKYRTTSAMSIDHNARITGENSS